MAKLTLIDISNLNNQQTAVANINSNSAAIETAFENTLSRDGIAPNQMLSDLDMNSNRILNLPHPVSSTEPIRLGDIGDLAPSSVMAVRYDTAQNLSLGQQTQALSNINDGDVVWGGTHEFTNSVQAEKFFSGSSSTAATQLELNSNGETHSTDSKQVLFSRVEALTPGDNIWRYAIGFHNRVEQGGTGNRGTVVQQMVVEEGRAGQFYAGADIKGQLLSGTGFMFGGGSYAVAEEDVDDDAQLISWEFDTLIKTDVGVKLGIRIADIEGSSGEGSITDAGLDIGRQVTARGFENGIIFGFTHPSLTGLYQFNRAFISAVAQPVPFGIDWSEVTFNDRAIKTPNFSVFPNGRVTVGSITGSGGTEILSVQGDSNLVSGKNNSQITIQGKTTATKLFNIGFDTNTNYGMLQVANDGVEYLPLHLNSLGGIIIASPLGIKLGGTSASYPYLKPSGADLTIRLADDSAYANLNVLALKVSETKVVGARDTGWTAMTNTANKNTSYDTTTVTLPQLAARVKSLQDALATHGLIGA